MAMWNVELFPPLFTPLAQLIGPSAQAIVRGVVLPPAVICASLLAWRVARRSHRISAAEGGFLLASLALFHPYLWVMDSNLATFAMLIGHFIQYLSIVWLLHRRRYAGQPGSAHQRWLGTVSSRPLLLGTTLVSAGLVFLLVQRLALAAGAPLAYLAVWNALTLVHFYLDGFIWAFKRPEVRATLGRALTPPERIVPA